MPPRAAASPLAATATPWPRAAGTRGRIWSSLRAVFPRIAHTPYRRSHAFQA
jgi:hypothetical protein